MQARFDNDIFLLPSEASKVVMQYYPTETVSCLLPQKTRKLVVTLPGETSELEITTPELLWSQRFWRNDHEHAYPFAVRPDQGGNPNYCICNNCNPQPRFFSEYRLYAIKVAPNGMFCKPYLLGNVHPEGKICWGKQPLHYQTVPDNLRHGNAIFWNAPFNMDLWPAYKEHPETCPKRILHKCTRRLAFDDEMILANKDHKYPPPNGSNLCQKVHQCMNMARNAPCKNEHLCSKFESVRHKKPNETEEAYRARYQNDRCPEIPGAGGFRGADPNSYCTCCNRECSCGNRCKCCTSRCACVTECNCCNSHCKCPCDCNLNVKFVSHLKHYNPEQDLGHEWQNLVKIMCGDKYISSPKHEDAIFLTSNRVALDKIPQELWRTDYLGQPFVVGFANRTTTGWKIKVEDYEFHLDSKYVNMLAANSRAKSTSPSSEIKNNQASPELVKASLDALGIPNVFGAEGITLDTPAPIGVGYHPGGLVGFGAVLGVGVPGDPGQLGPPGMQGVQGYPGIGTGYFAQPNYTFNVYNNVAIGQNAQAMPAENIDDDLDSDNDNP